LYAALPGSYGVGLASSTLRPTLRSDRPTSTAAPSRTNPVMTGTEIATPVSREADSRNRAPFPGRRRSVQNARTRTFADPYVRRSATHRLAASPRLVVVSVNRPSGKTVTSVFIILPRT